MSKNVQGAAMKKKITCFLVTAVLATCQTTPSFAYPVSYEAAAALDGSVLTSTYSWATVYTFNKDTDPGPYTFPATIEGGSYVSGFQSGQYAAPAINNIFSGIDQTQYLTTYGGGKTSIKFTSFYDYIGLFWGSMDQYNTLQLYNGTDLILSITGSDVSEKANGTQYHSPTNQYVNIFTPDLFNKIVMISTSNSFEVDNIAVGTNPVPESATMLLFGMGLIGLGALARRRNR
jgi:hypothetical protein